MLNLGRQKIEVEIKGEKYILSFDMKSIKKFKEMTGTGFLQSAHLIATFDDELILNFIAATLRSKENENEPLGEKIFELDILPILNVCGPKILRLISGGMPQDNKKGTKTKK